ncbi:MAG: (Fe-S)-binding protein [Cystobacterineae bacterium]|nr:(Fe-S)-binding protein [Cystobacterineae bacterium]
MNPLLTFLLLLVGLTAFAWTMRGRLRALGALSKDDQARTRPVGLRLKKLLCFGFGQRRLVLSKLEFWPGLMHVLIFLAFMLLALRTLSLFWAGFCPWAYEVLTDIHAPFWASFPLLKAAYGAYLFIKDGIAVLALIGVVYFSLWRALGRPSRVTASKEAYVILGLIAALMLTEFLFGAAFLCSKAFWLASGANLDALVAPTLPAAASTVFEEAAQVEPVTAWIAAHVLRGLSAQALFAVMQGAFWLHLTLVLVFLNLLPRGKHFHVLLALVNVFLQRLPVSPQASTSAALPTPKLEEEQFGMREFSQLSWKQGLDLSSCTECGRCTTHCPTHQTHKPLSAKGINLALRAYLWSREKTLLEAAKARGVKKEGEGEEGPLTAPMLGEGGLIEEEALWACTTCGWCEEACPVFIENIPRLMDMRRYRVQVEAQFPVELQRVFEGIERQSNPWGLAQEEREAWEGDLALPKWGEGGDYEYLFYVGCAGSYDERMKKVSRALASLLTRAGVRFATLGKQEMCTGDPARRAGNEYLFQTLAQANVETLNGLGVKAIITQCPHCYNTLKNEYPYFGGNYRVLSHVEFLAELLAEGRLKLKASDIPKLTFHDPCYLGRHNQIYEAPRQILKAIPGLELVEMQRRGRESFCCGAGGARMWMEEKQGERINHHRAQEAIETLRKANAAEEAKAHHKEAMDKGLRIDLDINTLGESAAGCIAVACPFCHTMLRDALSDLGKEAQLRVLDIAEVLAGAVEGPEE